MKKGSSAANACASGNAWVPGSAPIAVVMLALNEGHNMGPVLENLRGWAQEVFLVDSFSQDNTVDIALANGVNVVQRPFRGFGDQWNFALSNFAITAPWTMKLDPDERLSEELKASLSGLAIKNDCIGLFVARRLWFMGKPLPVRQHILRVWRTGSCRFSDVTVNEHPIVDGRHAVAGGDLEHHDSPDLDHWLEKQNRYTTAEAVAAYTTGKLADKPNLLGTPLQRRMWLKKMFYRIPLRYQLFLFYNWILLGAWRAGWIGYVWARLRVDYMRLIELKRQEIELTGKLPLQRPHGPGSADGRVRQYE